MPHLRALEATAPGDDRLDPASDLLVCNLGNGDGFSIRQVLQAAESIVDGRHVVLHGRQRNLELDFVVAPGAEKLKDASAR